MISKWDVSSVTNMSYMSAGQLQWRYFRMGCLFRHQDGACSMERQRSMLIFPNGTFFCRLFVFHVLRGDGLSKRWDLMSESETDSMFDGSSGGLDPKCGKCIATVHILGIFYELRYSAQKRKALILMLMTTMRSYLLLCSSPMYIPFARNPL
jgi:hypothetical protein